MKAFATFQVRQASVLKGRQCRWTRKSRNISEMKSMASVVICEKDAEEEEEEEDDLKTVLKFLA